MCRFSRPIRLIGSLFVFALLFEVVVRITMGAPRSERLPLIRVQPDPRLGFKPLSGDVHYGYDELIKLNKLGLRGGEVPLKKGQEYRVLVFGGTQVYGIGIPDDKLMSRVLEDRLNEEHNRRPYRIINFGVRAFNLRQQFLLLKDVGIELYPDHVVLLIDAYSFGDFDIPTYYKRIKARDWFMLDLDAKPEGYALGKWYVVQAARKSGLVAWLHHLYKAGIQRNSFSLKLLRGQKDPDIERRLGFLKEQIDAFAALAKRHRFHLSLAVIPFPSQISKDCSSIFFQQEIRELAKMQGLSFLDLLDPLRQLYRQTGFLPVAPFDAHYNAAAHETMAVSLLDQVRMDSAIVN